MLSLLETGGLLASDVKGGGVTKQFYLLTLGVFFCICVYLCSAVLLRNALYLGYESLNRD